MRALPIIVWLAVVCAANHGWAAGPSSKPPLYSGLANFSRPITTASPEAQRYFNQGLCFLYAFNHDEAIRSFEYAAKLDPNCPMAWWGIAVANGPRVLLADEPTGNLDPTTAELVFDGLTRLVRASKLAALIATHNHDLAQKMDRRITLKGGKVVEF